MLNAISPIDGRYQEKTKELSEYYSEYALIKYRVFVEIQYFIALVQKPLPQLNDFDLEKVDELNNLFENFNLKDAIRIKEIEKVTNHDVKAVEYYLKEKFEELKIEDYKEFIHFGLTSQDINNTATPYLIKKSITDIYLPKLSQIISELEIQANSWAGIPMLARTHGQPASPTTLGKEIKVFIERINIQMETLKKSKIYAKFGGATGNFNAHAVSYPSIDWVKFGDLFVSEYLGLSRSRYTTQIAHYDDLANVFQCMARVNTILIDYCRDIWTYVSMEYFKQKVIAGEVGSSAMPHKVNPIDFENAEGNLGIANALYIHLSAKLPISRLQRDLTDSTVLRNVGVPFAHSLIAMKSILKGMSKLLVNETKIHDDLEGNWMVIAEAIQNILRRESYPNPYEALKALTRGKASIGREDLHEFIDGLEVSDLIKDELKQITPHNYIGMS